MELYFKYLLNEKTNSIEESFMRRW